MKFGPVATVECRSLQTTVRAGRIPTRMPGLERYVTCVHVACSRPRRWAAGDDDRLVRVYLSCYKVAAPRPLPLEIDRALTAPPLHDSSSCKRSLGPRRAQDSATLVIAIYATLFQATYVKTVAQLGVVVTLATELAVANTNAWL